MVDATDLLVEGILVDWMSGWSASQVQGPRRRTAPSTSIEHARTTSGECIRRYSAKSEIGGYVARALLHRLQK